MEATDLRSEGPPQVGDLIAEKYRVESMVGSGGMGVVLAARHLQLGQTVAIKVLSAPEESRRAEANTRFIREAQAAATLRSDHVVRIYDVGTLPSGLPYMVMELLRGSDLGSLLDAEIKLDQTLAVDFLLQACDAIAEAHSAGIVHRDLKPSNLFVTERSDGSPLLKVLDFGISKTMGGTSDSIDGILTSTRQVMGSPYYMSPEQVRDARRVDGRSDIWALGVILHEALTGEPAFQADTFPGVCAAIVADPPLAIHTRRPDVHPELELVVMRCLEKDASRRFQTVAELIQALRPFSSRSSGSARRFGSVKGRPGNASGAQAASAPQASSGRNRSFVDDETISADQVNLPAVPPSARSAKVVTGDTSTQVSAGVEPKKPPPAAPAASPRKRWLLVAGAAAVVTCAALALLSSRGGGPAPAPSASVVAPSPQPAERGPSAAPPAIAETFTLSIDSTPPGAEVLEGTQSLGSTPLKLTMVSPETGKVRVLSLRKVGFKPYMLEQGPARGDVRIHAALVADEATPPVASTVPQRAHRPAAQSVPAKKPANTSPSPAPAGDIRLQR